jgi:hypothetical protein
MAKAALEMALWDLQARTEGRPLCEALGAPARPIASGVSIGIQPSPSALVDRVAEELAAGYQRIKIKIKPGWDREPVEAIRARFPDVPLMVDANAAYTLADAGRLEALDRFDLMMIEQPLSYDDLVRHAELQRRLRTPICLDESIHSPEAAADALELGACRIINIKPAVWADSVRRWPSTIWRARAAFRCGMAACSRAASVAPQSPSLDVARLHVARRRRRQRRYFRADLIEPPSTCGLTARLTFRGTWDRRRARDGIVWPPPQSGTARFRGDVLTPGRHSPLDNALGCNRPASPPVRYRPSRWHRSRLRFRLNARLRGFLRLEQQRVLADPAAGADLSALIKDANVGVRRRTALALGRIGGQRRFLCSFRRCPIPTSRSAARPRLRLASWAMSQAAAPLEHALADPAPMVRGPQPPKRWASSATPRRRLPWPLPRRTVPRLSRRFRRTTRARPESGDRRLPPLDSGARPA